MDNVGEEPWERHRGLQPVLDVRANQVDLRAGEEARLRRRAIKVRIALEQRSIVVFVGSTGRRDEPRRGMLWVRCRRR